MAVPARSGGAAKVTERPSGDCQAYVQPEQIATLPEDGFLFPTDRSPDGRFVVYDSRSPNDGDIWLLPLADGGEPQPLVRTPFLEPGAVISPEGRWLAFDSAEGENRHVFVQSFPEAGSRTQVSIRGGRSPRWTADGKQLFFVHGDELMVVELGLGEVVEPGTPELYLKETEILHGRFRSPNYAVTAAGQVLIAVRGSTADDAAQPPLRIIVNFIEELKARVGASN